LIGVGFLPNLLKDNQGMGNDKRRLPC